MPIETLSKLTVACCGTALVAAVMLQSLRCRQGWRLWWLCWLNNLLCRFAYGWKANRPCPFRNAPRGIVIANHRGPVDPLLIWVGMTNCRPISFMTAREYFGRPVLQCVFDATRAIPVARDGRDMAAMRQALRLLQHGGLVGVFPEGRINTGPGLLPFNPGIAWLALKSRAPVYPVYLENAPRADSLLAAFLDFRKARVWFADPIDLSDYYDRPLTSDLLDEVAQLFRSRVALLGNAGAPQRAARQCERRAG